MELLGQPAGVCRCVYEAMTHPLLLRLTQGQMLVRVCQQRHREREGLGAMAGCVFSLSSSLFTMHGGSSGIVCRQRGSKLIIQCAGNVSKASAGRLETSKGLFH